MILGLPIDLKICSLELKKHELRDKLKLPQSRKIITTVGSPQKYKTLLDLNFTSVATQILDNNLDVMIIVIGPDYRAFPEWAEIAKKTKDRFKILGRIPYAQVIEYLSASDVVLDSFPMSGGAALVDAVSAKRPALSLDGPIGQLDYVYESEAFCSNQRILLKKLYELLQSERERQKNICDVSKKLDIYNSSDQIKKNLKQIYSSVSKHKLHTFKPSKRIKINMLDIYLHIAVSAKKRKFSIKSLVRLLTHRK